jgi:hypothetical protein
MHAISGNLQAAEATMQQMASVTQMQQAPTSFQPGPCQPAAAVQAAAGAAPAPWPAQQPSQPQQNSPDSQRAGGLTHAVQGAAAGPDTAGTGYSRRAGLGVAGRKTGAASVQKDRQPARSSCDLLSTTECYLRGKGPPFVKQDLRE